MAVIIQVEKLSKQYRLGTAGLTTDSFREFLTQGLRRPWDILRGASGNRYQRSDREFLWALRDVNFEVEEGDVVGIVGRNGAGKSTLFKLLSRITDPTEGFIRIRGRLASLLEVGTGFHPELTGRENIFLNGAILGMKKSEIVSQFDEIVAFAEIGKFLDTPVKRYSSGMYVRLAFAVAAHLNPEILVVDEVLAVGDVAFQRKCLGKMSEVSQGGRTVLFVSHNMAAVENLCRRGLVLEQGRLVFGGTAKEAVDYYLHSLSGDGMGSAASVVDLTNAPGRRRHFQPLLKRLELFSGDGAQLNGGLPIGAPLKARIHFQLENPCSSFDACLAFDSLGGQRIFTAHSVFEPRRPHGERVGEQVFVCEIPSLALVPGEYKIKVGLDIGGTEVDSVEDATRLTVIESDYYGTGKVPWNGTCVLKHQWELG